MNNIHIPAYDGLEIIHLLVGEIKQVLQNRFLGFYLHGSLALGDFNPESSDVDFLVVTTEKIAPDEFATLTEVHAQIGAAPNKWANRLEGSYIDVETLQRTEPPAEPRPYLNGGVFSEAKYGNEWVLERYVLREYGIAVVGPSPVTLLKPITLGELQQACWQILQEWWAPMLSDPARLDDSEYQVYAILTMCRSLYLFTQGEFVSKKKAAEWADTALEDLWGDLIRAAVEWKHGQTFAHFNDTLAFIKFTLSQVSKEHNQPVVTEDYPHGSSCL